MFAISYGLYVAGSQIDGKNAGCVVDAFIQSTSAPVPAVILCSIQANQTNAAIKQTGEFTVSVLGTDVDPFVIGNFGFQSGRNADKSGNVPHKLVDGLPVLETAVAYCVARLRIPHTAFYCEVVDAWSVAGDPLKYGEYHKGMKTKSMANMGRLFWSIA